MGDSKKALIASPTGEIRTEYLDGTLEQQQAWVGGLIQPVALPSMEITMWVNEEFLFTGNDVNKFASALYEDEYGRMTNPILGTVYFTGDADAEGNTEGLSPTQIQELQQIAVWFVALDMGEGVAI